MATAKLSAAVAGMLLVLVMTAGTASAGFIGETVRVETQFPDQGVICCGAGQAVVSNAVEFPPGSFPQYNANAFVDIFDTQIEYGQTAGTTYTPANFNGFRFFDVLGDIDAIINVSINAATNLSGFDSSRVSFDADNIFINMQGLSAGEAHHVVLDVSFAAVPAVPAPATLLLLGGALAGLGVLRRLRA